MSLEWRARKRRDLDQIGGRMIHLLMELRRSIGQMWAIHVACSPERQGGRGITIRDAERGLLSDGLSDQHAKIGSDPYAADSAEVQPALGFWNIIGSPDGRL